MSTFNTCCDPAIAFSLKGLYQYLMKELASMAEVFEEEKAVLLLSSMKTYDIFFECLVASASSGPFQTLVSSLLSCQLVTFFLKHVSLTTQTLSISAAAPIAYISDMSTGSNRHCRTEWVWLVRLSQQFIGIS